MFKVGIVGFGKAGGRFLRAFIYRNRKYNDVKVTAVCDLKRERIKNLTKYGIVIYTDIEEMLNSEKFDILVITTNEDSHFSILEKIKQKGVFFKKILVEKLLVENSKQAERLKQLYSDKEISIHFIERHSKIVKNSLKWISENNLKISRATFHWGKYRLHDHRPTGGVLTEMSHPIDLIMYMANFGHNTPFNIIQGNYIFSNYSFYNNSLIDTVNINLEFNNNLIINGNSSFLWDKRERKIILFLSNSENIIQYMVSLIFDNPHWDMDVCNIYDVFKSPGKLSLIKTIKTTEKDIDKELLCVNKVANFIEENIKELIIPGYRSSSLAHLFQGAYTQKIIESLQNEASNKFAETKIFCSNTINLNNMNDGDDLLYSYLDGNNNEVCGYKWDNEAYA